MLLGAHHLFCQKQLLSCVHGNFFCLLFGSYNVRSYSFKVGFIHLQAFYPMKLFLLLFVSL